MRRSCFRVQRGFSITVPSLRVANVVKPTSIPTAVENANFSGAGPTSQTTLAVHRFPSRLIVQSLGVPGYRSSAARFDLAKVGNFYASERRNAVANKRTNRNVLALGMRRKSRFAIGFFAAPEKRFECTINPSKRVAHDVAGDLREALILAQLRDLVLLVPICNRLAFELPSSRRSLRAAL